VFSKRPIVVDEEYDHDRIVWCREDDGEVEATALQHYRFEALHRNYREPVGWRRLAIKEIDHFETACFTEQGCKDYLEVNGHNLRKPFIYAHSLYRNREMLELRKMLMAEQGSAAVSYERFDLIAHLERQVEFSQKTFGPNQRTSGVLDHLRKELSEVEKNPDDISEWIDVVLLALDEAWRRGFSPEEICKALAAKQQKNENRVWPDWRTAPEDKAIEHVEGDAA
jgi:hypothetical protein